MLKNLLAVQETRVQSLNWEDPLEKKMATHSSILAWRIPLAEEPGGPQFMELPRVGRDRATNTHTRKEKEGGREIYLKWLRKKKTTTKTAYLA